MKSIDVLVVNYLSGDLVETAFETLVGAAVALHVWDNSGDISASLQSRVTMYGDGSNALFAGPNNRMFEATTAPYVLLLNPDVAICPRSLAALVGALDVDPLAWGAMPRLLDVSGQDQNYLRRLPTLRALLADRFPPLRKLWRRHVDRYYCRDLDLRATTVVEQPPAACLLLRRSAVGRVIFDESYPLFFNDVDLARRLNKDGHCLYASSVTATHIGGASIARARASRRQWIRREYDRSLLRYARRNLRGAAVLVPVIVVRVLGAYFLGYLERIRGLLLRS
jgi:N-acetylglucosaminyl-diphospho-decaprenol L-rhamnosyltransferase